MTETQSPTRQTRYWRSLDELERTEEFREFAAREFPEGADSIDGVDRRRFLQLMGASTALAGASSCRWEKTEILPFVERPEGRVPGVPVHYATAMELASLAPDRGLLVPSARADGTAAAEAAGRPGACGLLRSLQGAAREP